MNTRSKQTFLQIKHIDGQKTKTKTKTKQARTLSITIYQRNANQKTAVK